MSKWKITALLIVVCIVFAAGGYLFLRIHNGIKIKPAGEHVISKEVISYRQDDAEWAPDHLGDSPYTMKSSGCLVTCIASAISNSGEKVTPEDAWLTGFLLSFGTQVEILSPAYLRDVIAKQAQQIYEKNKP